MTFIIRPSIRCAGLAELTMRERRPERAATIGWLRVAARQRCRRSHQDTHSSGATPLAVVKRFPHNCRADNDGTTLPPESAPAETSSQARSRSAKPIPSVRAPRRIRLIRSSGVLREIRLVTTPVPSGCCRRDRTDNVREQLPKHFCAVPPPTHSKTPNRYGTRQTLNISQV
jgi:hypothetical protein